MKSDKAWIAHCKEMQRLYDVKAAELVAQGWKKHDKGINQYFTKSGQTPVVICRQLGSSVWYVEEKS